MGFLDRKSLLQTKEPRVERVDLGDGDFVFVCEMTGRQRDQFERSLYEVNENDKGEFKFNRRLENFRAKLAVCTVCDERGVLLMTAKDVDTFSDCISAVRLEKIVEVAQRVNRITEEDKEALTKNFEGGQAADSGSNSAEN